MRIILAITMLAVLAGCPHQTQAGKAAGDAPASGGAQVTTDALTTAAAESVKLAAGGRVAMLFSGTESDPWTTQIIDTLGADLGVDLWAKPVASEYFDLFGPYELKRDGKVLTLDICLCGFTGVSSIAGQEALGAEARAWIEGIKPDVAWLDGDPVQFQVGSRLDPSIPIVFSGVVIERRLYYEDGRQITGVYERYSLPTIMAEIWRQNAEAKKVALLIDDSPNSAGRAQRFMSFATALPEGSEFVIPPATHNWDELKAALREVQDEVDAVIFCGVGEEGCSSAFMDKPAPDDFMWGIDKPVVVLGPSQLDYCGAVSFRLKPAVHARAAFDLVERVLEGVDPLTMLSVTPDDLAVFVAEKTVE